LPPFTRRGERPGRLCGSPTGGGAWTAGPESRSVVGGKTRFRANVTKPLLGSESHADVIGPSHRLPKADFHASPVEDLQLLLPMKWIIAQMQPGQPLG
jgi:hypothetical protein